MAMGLGGGWGMWEESRYYMLTPNS
jgi:hypothetical protein